jgi:DNA topoisomerase-1
MKNLVIVESPAKAKTIEKFLGADFKVVSCKGHIRDLVDGNNAIDIKNGFQPHYVVSDDKVELVRELKKLVKSSEIVWLATDEDREGEAISWHLYEELGLKKIPTKRIVFNEITKPAILKAVENPRDIDQFLVDAQQARRILDRIVGYSLSPVLWTRVRTGLSAGRVQSVAVRLVVEREREITEFNTTADFKVSAEFETSKGKKFKADLPQRFKTSEEAKKFLETLKGANYQVNTIEVKPTYRNPAPPFTTSTLQQEASRKLGYDVSRTMQIAQKLYENGHISYMRTDSVNLSGTAIEGAKNEILSAYGEKFSNPRNFNTKSSGAQEAHEAIRPTYFNNHSAGSNPQEKKLYELIWKRAIASQMSRAELEKTVVNIGNNKNSSIFKAEGEVVKFEGFLKVYLESTDDENDQDQEGMLPAMFVNETLVNHSVVATEKYDKHPPRYSEAALVKKLEELGIGRPSTYAPTIKTVQQRGYIQTESRIAQQRSIKIHTLKGSDLTDQVIKENYGAEKNKLFPTDIGMLVTDFLASHFSEIMDYGFTAAVEKEFDEIAEGLKSWQNMLEEFYGPFKTNLQSVSETASRVNGERILGIDPISGKTVLVRMGQYGPMVQLGSREETETPVYASLLSTQRLESVTFNDAIQLLSVLNNGFDYKGEPVVVGNGRYGPYLKLADKYINLSKEINVMSLNQDSITALLDDHFSKPSFPLDLGVYQDKKVTVGAGRFGPYVKHGNLFASIPKNQDPFQITLDSAIELITKKAEADSKKILKTFTENEDVSVQDGRYGPYIKYGKENIKMPKGMAVEDVTYAVIQELAKDIVSKTSKSAKTSKTATKSSAKAAPKKKVATKKAAKK